jgi:hypothetical protein
MTVPTSWTSASEPPARRTAASTAAESAGVQAVTVRPPRRAAPNVQQVGLLLPEPHRQARQVVLDIAGGEPLDRAWAGVMWIADGRGLGDEPLELASLGAGRLFGAALDEDPLTRDRVGSDDPVTGLGGGGGVDAGAVLELGQRLLAVAGHDSGPPRGTQRSGCYGWPPSGTLCPKSVPGSESTLHTPYPTRPNVVRSTQKPLTRPRVSRLTWCFGSRAARLALAGPSRAVGCCDRLSPPRRETVLVADPRTIARATLGVGRRRPM